MKNKKAILFFAFSVLPLAVFADHEDVLLTPLISFVSILIFIVFMFLVRLGFYGKVTLFLAYFFSTAFIYSYISDIPFDDNKQLINLSVAVIPYIVVAITWLIIKLWFPPQKES